MSFLSKLCFWKREVKAPQVELDCSKELKPVKISAEAGAAFLLYYTLHLLDQKANKPEPTVAYSGDPVLYSHDWGKQFIEETRGKAIKPKIICANCNVVFETSKMIVYTAVLHQRDSLCCSRSCGQAQRYSKKGAKIDKNKRMIYKPRKVFVPNTPVYYSLEWAKEIVKEYQGTGAEFHLICKECDSAFTRSKNAISIAVLKNTKQMFCSKECFYNHVKPETKTCLCCGEIMKTRGSMYCSRQCVSDHRRVTLACNACGKTVVRRLSDAHKNGSKNVYCNWECYANKH